MWKSLTVLRAFSSHLLARDSLQMLLGSSLPFVPWLTFHLLHFFSFTLMVNLHYGSNSCSIISEQIF